MSINNKLPPAIYDMTVDILAYYMLECFHYFSEDKNELVRAMVKMDQDGQSTIAGIINKLFLPLGKTRGIVIIMSLSVDISVDSITRLNLIRS